MRIPRGITLFERLSLNFFRDDVYSEELSEIVNLNVSYRRR